MHKILHIKINFKVLSLQFFKLIPLPVSTINHEAVIKRKWTKFNPYLEKFVISCLTLMILILLFGNFFRTRTRNK